MTPAAGPEGPPMPSERGAATPGPWRRAFYVSLIREKRTALLAGPYDTHDEALQMVRPARRVASEIDPWSDFDLIGTCSLETATPPRGIINDRLTLAAAQEPPR